MSFGSWFVGFDAGVSGTLQQAALAYLIVAVLAPLSWIVAVEVCRRFRTSARAAEDPCRVSSASRSVSVADLSESRDWWLQDQAERG